MRTGRNKSNWNEGQKLALVYCRVSTKGQEDGTSLDSQAQACIRHAESLGYAVARVTKEIFSGAELWDRPQLAKDRADLRAGRYHALVCYAIDRLSRDIAHLAIISEECERAGAQLLFVTEDLDNSAQGKLMRSVQSYAAEVEREKIKERSMRGKRAKLQSGRLLATRKSLFGYRNDPATGKREVYPQEAQIVRQMFQWVLEGCGILHIRRRLFESNTLPPEGKTYPDGHARPWPTSTIQKILRDPAYKGETYVFQFCAATKENPCRRRPKSEHLKLPDDTTPLIISPDMWQAVQHRLDSNKGDFVRNIKHQFLLRGLAVCEVCGHRMYSDSTKDYRYYRCSSRKLEGTACGSDLVSADQVEAAVWKKVSTILREPEIIADEIKRQQKSGADSQLSEDRAAAQRRLAKIEREQQRLIRRLRDTEDDGLADLYEREIIQGQNQKRQLEKAIADIDARLAAEQRAIQNLQSLTAYCTQVASKLSTFSFDEKRLALEAVGAKVQLNGKKWILQTRIPYQTVGDVFNLSRSCGRRIYWP